MSTPETSSDASRPESSLDLSRRTERDVAAEIARRMAAFRQARDRSDARAHRDAPQDIAPPATDAAAAPIRPAAPARAGAQDADAQPYGLLQAQRISHALRRSRAEPRAPAMRPAPAAVQPAMPPAARAEDAVAAATAAYSTDFATLLGSAQPQRPAIAGLDRAPARKRPYRAALLAAAATALAVATAEGVALWQFRDQVLPGPAATLAAATEALKRPAQVAAPVAPEAAMASAAPDWRFELARRPATVASAAQPPALSDEPVTPDRHFDPAHHPATAFVPRSDPVAAAQLSDRPVTPDWHFDPARHPMIAFVPRSDPAAAAQLSDRPVTPDWHFDPARHLAIAFVVPADGIAADELPEMPAATELAAVPVMAPPPQEAPPETAPQPAAAPAIAAPTPVKAKPASKPAAKPAAPAIVQPAPRPRDPLAALLAPVTREFEKIGKSIGGTGGAEQREKAMGNGGNK